MLVSIHKMEVITMSDKNEMIEFVYDLNKSAAEATLAIPLIGGYLHESQKLTCDYVINPIVIGGTHIGCDAIEDVYNAHHGLPSKQETGANVR